MTDERQSGFIKRLFGKKTQAAEAGLVTPDFSGSPPADPEAMTGAFIRDYLLWNDFSFQNYERTNDFGLASSAYDALVAKYPGPAKEHLLTTFSSHSSHSPTTTKIESAAYLEQSAKIVTLNEDVNGFITRYEYHYVQKGGVWLLDGLYYIDDYDNDARLPIL